MAQLLSNILFANNTLLLDTTALTASNNQTSFSANYTAPFVEVYLNGAKLVKDVDFTASSGSAVVLNEGAGEGDIVEVVKFKAGNIYGDSVITAGTNLNGGGSVASANVTINLDTTITGIDSITATTVNATQISTTESLTANTYVATNGFTGDLTGNVTGDLTGTVQTAAQPNITSVGTLTGLNAASANVTGEFVATSYNETVVALSGTTPTANCEQGNFFTLTTSGTTTWTFGSPPSSDFAYGMTIKLTAGGTHTINWPASVDWAGGTAPDAPASGETDILVFVTEDAGTNWYGALAIDAAATP